MTRALEQVIRIGMMRDQTVPLKARRMPAVLNVSEKPSKDKKQHKWEKVLYVQGANYLGF